MPPHEGQEVVEAGVPLGRSPVVAIMVHGRNAGPANILDLARRFDRPGITYVAPAAAGRTWYPHSFMAAIDSNEPGISSGLAVLDSLVQRVEAAGIKRSAIVLAFRLRLNNARSFSRRSCLHRRRRPLV